MLLFHSIFAEPSWKLYQNLLIICWVIARFSNGQSAWWSRSPWKFNHSFYHPGPLHKISSQSVHNFLSNIANKQTERQTNKQTYQHYWKHNLLANLKRARLWSHTMMPKYFQKLPVQNIPYKPIYMDNNGISIYHNLLSIIYCEIYAWTWISEGWNQRYYYKPYILWYSYTVSSSLAVLIQCFFNSMFLAACAYHKTDTAWYEKLAHWASKERTLWQSHNYDTIEWFHKCTGTLCLEWFDCSNVLFFLWSKWMSAMLFWKKENSVIHLWNLKYLLHIWTVKEWLFIYFKLTCYKTHFSL